MRLQELFEALSPAAIEATSGRFGQQLMAKLARDPQGASMKDDPAKFIEWVADEIDPTGNSKYTKWIVARFVDPNGGIRFVEDLSKLTEPMTRYARLTQSGVIPANSRDINQFRNMNSFLDLMDQYAEKKTGREERQDEEQALIKSRQAVLYKDTGAIKIMIPNTEEAAKFYGRGTKWCTASENNNRFDYYNKQGPLYDIIFRGSGVKWQFHFETAQFMNEQDVPLVPDLVKPISGLFSEDMWMAAVKYAGNTIRYIQSPSKAVQLAAVVANGSAIRYIENPSEAVQMAAVSENGYAIEYIKNPSKAVQLAAVDLTGGPIMYIENPTEAVQLAAVNGSWAAIRYIENPSEAAQLASVNGNWQAIQYIKNPSEAAQIAAVKEDGYAIDFIVNPTEAAKLAAVKQNAYAIGYIYAPSKAVQLAAVSENWRAISLIKYPSEAVQLAAVNANGNAIMDIKNPSEAVQLAAVKSNGNTIRHIKNPSPAVQALANLKRS